MGYLSLGGQSEINQTDAMIATTGMTIHSITEGFSIGGSLFCKSKTSYTFIVSMFGKSSLGMLVVVALLIHKAPESVGLGSYLVSRDVGAKQAFNFLMVRVQN